MDTGKNQTVYAFIRLGCILLSSVLTLLGIAIKADDIFIVVTCILEIVFGVISWWKNNNVTYEAKIAQKVLNNLKNERDV